MSSKNQPTAESGMKESAGSSGSAEHRPKDKRRLSRKGGKVRPSQPTPAEFGERGMGVAAKE